MIFTTDNRAAADLGKTNIYSITEIFGRRIVFFLQFFWVILVLNPGFFKGMQKVIIGCSQTFESAPLSILNLFQTL